MAKDTSQISRSKAEARFDKALKTTIAAKAQIDAEGEARRAKTAKLKTMRLAKEASDQEAEAERKRAEPAVKPRAKKAKSAS